MSDDLSSLRIPNYIKNRLKNPVFDYVGLSKVVQVITRTMDRIIDRNHYPVKEAMISNLLHRPIGIGTSGLADTLCLLRVPYESPDGVRLSGYITETIAYGAYSESTKMAKLYSAVKKETEKKYLSKQIFELFEEYKKRRGLIKLLNKMERDPQMDLEEHLNLKEEIDKYCENPVPKMIPLMKKLGVYPSYYYGTGACVSKGEFQWKMWGLEKKDLSGMWDWESLEHHIAIFGIRNSMLTAQMPTATTAQIMGCNESVEPFTSNIYRRAVLSGEFVVFNKYLIRDLKDLGLWNLDMKNYLIMNEGSIQNIDIIPDELKILYKTVWDIEPKVSVDHAIARGPFLDHSQSFNIFLGNCIPLEKRSHTLYKILEYGHRSGLKTGMYYLRTQPAINAQKFSVPINFKSENINKNFVLLKPLEKVEEIGCLSCGT